MSDPRFYTPRITPQLTLGPPQAIHALASRRLRVGDRVVLFDGQGNEAIACITETRGRKSLILDVEPPRRRRRPAAACLTVAAAVCKAHRQRWLVEKLTELGVGTICPLVTARTVAVPKDLRCRLQSARSPRPAGASSATNPLSPDQASQGGWQSKWHRWTIQAAQQSAQAWLPQVSDMTDLADLLARASSFDLALLATAQPEAPALLAVLGGCSKQPDMSIIILVGPEGGFTPAEIAAAEDHGFRKVRLGQTLLRVETAALATAATIAAWCDSPT